MPLISLTDLVDIVSASGTPKATKVKAIKNRPEYSPAFDFYKRLREQIVEIHRDDLGKRHLNASLTNLTDIKKENAYPPIIAGYKKWWGNKKLKWFDPPSEIFEDGGVEVRINPELGLKINGKPHLIKLYFKAENLAKNKIDIITHLMSMVLPGECPRDTTMSVLDVRRSKLFSPTVQIEAMSAMISAEMAYIATLWNSL